MNKGKCGKRDRSSYRPVSVLENISMIMERNDLSQILCYFIKHNLIFIDQFAFLKKTLYHRMSQRIIYDWYEGLNKGEVVMVFFVLFFIFCWHQKVLWLHQSCNTPGIVSSVWQMWPRFFLISINDLPHHMYVLSPVIYLLMIVLFYNG